VNILIFSQYFWPENFRINDLTSYLIAKNHKVTILTGYPNYPDGQIYSDFVKNKEKYKFFENAQIIRCPIIPRGKNKFFLILNYTSFFLSVFFFSFYKLFSKKFDLIFVFGLSPITSYIPAIILSKIIKKPLVLWILDLWPETLIDLNVIQNKQLKNIFFYFSNKIYSRSHKILVQSRSFKTKLEKRIKNKNIEYFPAWVEKEYYLNYEEIEFSKEILIDKKLFTIMFTGNIGEAQNFAKILSAAKSLSDKKYPIRWIVVGGGSKLKWLKNKITSLKIKNFIITGSYKLEKMPSIIKHANVLLLTLKSSPTFNFTIPGKLQSYMFSKKPILGSISGEAADIILQSKSGLVSEPDNEFKLIKNIETFMKLDNVDMKKMGLNGYDFAIKNFDRFKQLKKLNNIFNEMINE